MLNQTEKTEKERVFGISQIKKILNTDVSELKNLCKRACLRPKKDKMGSIYFSHDDVTVLQKLKSLNKKTNEIENRNEAAPVAIPEVQPPVNEIPQRSLQAEMLERTLQNFENNIVDKITSVLSEKMDGLDEVVVDLIRAKTENEALRQRINELNKENFNLKTENASYKPTFFGFYKKEETNDFVL